MIVLLLFFHDYPLLLVMLTDFTGYNGVKIVENILALHQSTESTDR